MWREWRGVAVVVAALAAGLTARAESAAVLLEKGVYAEETAGDLDGAIKIYEQIVADAQAARPKAAEAHLRLGICYAKKGDAAIVAFGD